jgi:hypothetical protein
MHDASSEHETEGTANLQAGLKALMIAMSGV